MTRATLPTRRPNCTVSVDWQGRPLDVTIGFDPATGQPREVFANTPKGGDMQAALADASVILSIALQHGIAPADLGKSLGRVPVLWGDEGATQPASPVGAIVEAILAEVRT
jgi:ribonucleoside-diphosphate reductase alpha chain